MSESVLKKFGKYFLLDRVGEGGMAEIFRARLASPDSSGRFIVIKRIQGAYSNNQEFLQMFRSEVQVTMRFTHPNIVQLYEAGEENGQQYIAMELVDGRNLRQVLSKIGHKRERIPVPASCYMIEQTAAGLHYAHSFKDRITGEPLNLVHRDVSPQNILVSYDGNIKVIDFGIAKATTNGEATRAGVIKGKLSYLSPEQVMGEVLDSRSDIFALGIVLWELLTGKRLFVAEGDNEFQVLKMIESCNSFVKPPSTINPEVSKELDAVVMQALTRDPKKRFQTGEEMARALRKVLATQYSDFGSSDLSTFVKKLFQDLIVEDRKQLQQLNGRAEELIALGVQTKEEPVTTQSDNSPDKIKEHTRVTQFLGDKFDKSQLTSADRLEVAGHPQRQMKIPVGRPVQPAGGQPARANQTASMRRPAQPVAMPSPVVENSSNGGGMGFFKGLMALSILGAGGFFGYQHFIDKASKEERSLASQSSIVKTLPTSGKTVSMQIRLFPDGDFSKTRVTVNSQPVDMTQGTIDVPVNDLLDVTVSRDGFETYRKEFTIKNEEVQAGQFGLDIKLVPMVYGRLSISTSPAVANVTIINLDQGTKGVSQSIPSLQTPITQEKLPAGHYRVEIRNSLGQEKSFQVEIKEGHDSVFTDVALEMKN
jgi:serine/threonine protein kinase